MDDRAAQGSTAERPITAEGRIPDPAHGHAGPLDDPRALTILTTEHWSLLSSRSLVYNEAFSRGGMFLTFLSATLVALGLVSTATGFTREFLLITAGTLAVDLFIGIATLGRVASATADDLRYLAGMNRIRHAYHEIVPGLDRYFIAGQHDDVRGVFEVYGAAADVTSAPGILHGLTTTPGMLGAICAIIAGALGGVVVLLVVGAPLVAGISAALLIVVGLGVSTAVMAQKIGSFAASMRPIFPHPEHHAGARDAGVHATEPRRGE